MRTVEALAIRLKDINFDVKPTTIHIRAEFSKRKRSRDIFISDEATEALRDRIKLKYKGRLQAPHHLVFHQWPAEENPNPRSLYPDMKQEFSKVRDAAGFVERKDNSKRHVVTLNSFRAFVDTTISNSAGKDFAEWFLGHSKSPYWKAKPDVKREIYLTKCVQHLTFLDISGLETMERNNEASLLTKEEHIAVLRQEITQQRSLVNKSNLERDQQIEALRKHRVERSV